MRTALLVIAMAAGCAREPGPVLPPPTVNTTRGLPVFTLECPNTLDTSVNPLDVPEAIRLDGTTIPMARLVGSSLGGMPRAIRPGENWTVRIVLHPRGASQVYSSADGPAIHKPVDLAAGRHSLAIQCFGHWSREVSFTYTP